MQKLYCYVDETGQDTQGEMFIVVVSIITDNNRELEKRLIKLEQDTKKLLKWNRSSHKQRSAFMEGLGAILNTEVVVYWSCYHSSNKYQDLTSLTVIRAITSHATIPYQSTIILDGASKKNVRKISTILRKHSIYTKKVKGERDDSNVFLRLSDSCAGFIRDVLEGHEEAGKLFKMYEKKEFFKKV